MHARLSRTGVGQPPDSRWRPFAFRFINLTRKSRITRLAVTAMLPCAPSYTAAQVYVDSALQARAHAEILTSSPALAAADSHITGALALRRAAESAPLTSVAAELEEIPDGFNLGDAGNIRLTVERELFTGGREGALGGQAEAIRIAAELQRRALAQRLIAESDRWIVGWAASRAALNRLEAEDSLLAAAEEALTARFAAGEARYGDVLRLRTERLRVRIGTAAARRDTEEAQVRLSALAPGLRSWVDSGTAKITVDSLAADIRPAPSLDSLIVLSGRAVILDNEVQQAEALGNLARAEGRTRVTAALGAQRFVGENGDFVVGPVLGASVSLPFTSSRSRATVDAADAELSSCSGHTRRGACRVAGFDACRTEPLRDSSGAGRGLRRSNPRGCPS